MKTKKTVRTPKGIGEEVLQIDDVSKRLLA